MAYGQKAVERARRQARAGATEDDIRRNLESDFQAETDRQVGASRASRASSLAADAKQKADAKSKLIRAGPMPRLVLRGCSANLSTLVSRVSA